MIEDRGDEDLLAVQGMQEILNAYATNTPSPD